MPPATGKVTVELTGPATGKLVTTVHCAPVPKLVDCSTTTSGIAAYACSQKAFDYLSFNCYKGPSLGNPVLRDPAFRPALNWGICITCCCIDGVFSSEPTGVRTPPTGEMGDGDET